MPAGDGTGPVGIGPMTGRAAGYCAGYDRPGYATPGGGYGVGMQRRRGRGRGRGMRGGYYSYPAYGVGVPPYDAAPPPAVQQGKDALAHRARVLQQELARINDLLASYDTADSSE